MNDFYDPRIGKILASFSDSRNPTEHNWSVEKLDTMVKSGFLEKDKPSVYRLTPRGRRYLVNYTRAMYEIAKIILK